MKRVSGEGNDQGWDDAMKGQGRVVGRGLARWRWMET